MELEGTLDWHKEHRNGPCSRDSQEHKVKRKSYSGRCYPSAKKCRLETKFYRFYDTIITLLSSEYQVSHYYPFPRGIMMTNSLGFVCLFVWFWRGAHYVDQANFKLEILLPLPPRCSHSDVYHHVLLPKSLMSNTCVRLINVEEKSKVII